jgi:hypothetical protein
MLKNEIKYLEMQGKSEKNNYNPVGSLPENKIFLDY